MPIDEINKEKTRHLSHVRIATKYPHLTSRHYARQGIQAECIKLNGAMEIAPSLGLARRIVDLVSTGNTLKANNMAETEKIMDISSRLIVNRSIQKTHPEEISYWVDAFCKAVR